MLELKNISKTFNAGTVNAKLALSGLNLTLADGDFVTVIGGNGAGKSTMLNAIAGVWKPDEGQILIDGVDVTGMPEYKRAKFLGRVFQDPMIGTAAGMWLEENLSIAYRRGKPRTLRWAITQKERAQYREMLAQLDLGLEDRLTTRVGLLSGGQRQAVTLLMATMNRPKLLLLDEHTAALDPKTADKVLQLTDRLISEEKLTALMITHNMRDAITHGNRLIMIGEDRPRRRALRSCIPSALSDSPPSAAAPRLPAAERACRRGTLCRTHRRLRPCSADRRRPSPRQWSCTRGCSGQWLRPSLQRPPRG
ncbi:MAG: ATP-binding cassette domain-containing protein, partial [Clostridia bacterium]|nr:ATP-binding cassette domain-containing protein [Clostridia bacterium]